MIKFLLLSLFVTNAFAFPIFYQCSDKGEMLEVESGKDLLLSLKQFQGMDQAEIDKLGMIYCKGNEQCLARLKQAGILSGQTYEVVYKLYENELSKINLSLNESHISEDQLKLLQNLRSYKELISCKSAMAEISQEKKDKIPLYYPHYSNYMYITGCQRMSGGICNALSKNDVKESVVRALAAGIDPYLLISIAMMENGVSIDSLYLDPIGIVKALGCQSKSVSGLTEGALDSYGTYYKVTPGVKTRPDFNSYLDRFAKISDQKLEKKKSFYCIGVSDAGGIPGFSAAPKTGHCCLDVPYTGLKPEDMTKHLVTLYIKDMQKEQIPFNKTDPAFTVQKFNGFSNLMGGAEGVQLYRTGLNYFKEPSYGYQAMDFIVNSLMTNKEIKDIVKEESDKGGFKVPGIFCKGKAAGFYAIESDTYFTKHSNAKRMGVIEEKFKKGQSYDQLTERERRVFNRELQDPKVQELLGLKNPIYSEKLFENADSTLSELSLNTEKDLYSGMKPIETYKKEIRSLGLTDDQATLLYQSSEIDYYSSKFKDINAPDSNFFELSNKLTTTMEENEDGLTKYCQNLILKQKPAKAFESLQQKTDDEKKSILKKYGVTGDLDPQNLEQLYNQYLVNIADNIKSAMYTNNKTKVISLAKREHVMQAAADMARIRTPKAELEEKVLKNHPDKKDEFNKAYDTYFAQIEGAKEFDKINKNQLFKKYFKEVYASRDTLKEAAAFPWREFTDEEVGALKDKLNGQP